MTKTSAVSGGRIRDNGGDDIYGQGICWSTTPNPTIASNNENDRAGTSDFFLTMTDLVSNTTYYVRAYAFNSEGIAYGNEVSFTLWLGYPGPQLTDIDGNNYKTVRIGTQLWMAENLKTTNFNDCELIPLVTDVTEWNNLTTPAYYWLHNMILYKNLGALYNGYTVNTGKLCPTGWHIPTDSEWKVMEMYLGMSQEQADSVGWRGTDQGFQLKDSLNWPCHSPGDCEHNKSYGGSNVSGFSAVPNGLRLNSFESVAAEDYFLSEIMKHYKPATWWTTSIENISSEFWYREVDGADYQIRRNHFNKNYGFGVRCIKNSN
jgi:uncharacterized protein (TIGR02145 family)